MMLLFTLFGCVPCCHPVTEKEVILPREPEPIRCEPDVRDCYIAPIYLRPLHYK